MKICMKNIRTLTLCPFSSCKDWPLPLTPWMLVTRKTPATYYRCNLKQENSVQIPPSTFLTSDLQRHPAGRHETWKHSSSPLHQTSRTETSFTNNSTITRPASRKPAPLRPLLHLGHRRGGGTKAALGKTSWSWKSAWGGKHCSREGCSAASFEARWSSGGST